MLLLMMKSIEGNCIAERRMPRKQKKEKERRLIAKADEILKLITNGHVLIYNQQQESKRMVMTANRIEWTLKPEFHTNVFEVFN